MLWHIYTWYSWQDKTRQDSSQENMGTFSASPELLMNCKSECRISLKFLKILFKSGKRVRRVTRRSPAGAKVKSECKHCLFSGLNICVCFRDIYLFTGLFRSRIYKTFTPKCLDFSSSALRLGGGWGCSGTTLHRPGHFKPLTRKDSCFT